MKRELFSLIGGGIVTVAVTITIFQFLDSMRIDLGIWRLPLAFLIGVSVGAVLRKKISRW